MFSGIVALLLQANPILTPQQIKQILSRTAYKDNFTTNAPDSTRWGFGKANAYGMIKEAILMSGVKETKNKELNSINIYPNPSNGNYWVEFETVKKGNVEIVVCDMMGKILFENIAPCQIGLNKLAINHPTVIAGIYILKFKVNGIETTKRIVLN
jgi:hypothetical protein